MLSWDNERSVQVHTVLYAQYKNSYNIYIYIYELVLQLWSYCSYCIIEVHSREFDKLVRFAMTRWLL